MIRKSSSPSLVRHLSLSVGLLCAVIVLIVTTLLFAVFSGFVRDRMHEQAAHSMDFLTTAMEAPLWFMDIDVVQAISKATILDQGIGLLEVRDNSGKLLFYHTSGTSLFVILEADIRHEGKVIGHVSLGLDDAVRIRTLWTTACISGAIALVLILAQYVLTGFFLRRFLRRPFGALNNLLGAFARGEYLQPDPGIKDEEFTPLVHTLLAMGQTIQKQIVDLKHSEDKYRTLFETMPNGFYRSTHDGYFLEANPAFIEMLGYDNLEELKKVYIPTDLYVIETERGEVVADNPDFSNQVEYYRLRRKDGRIIQIEDNARYIKDENDIILYHEGICRDVTERKEAEEKLRQSEEKFAQLFRLSADAIILTRLADASIFDVNEAFCRITGFTRQEAVGKTTQELGLYANPQAREQVMDALASRGRIENFEIELRRKDGVLRNCILSCQLLTFDQNLCVMAEFRDVTELKRMQEMMVQTEKMVSLGGIAAGVAHEINNPLGIIMASAQTLTQRILPDFPRNVEVAQKIGLDMKLLDTYMQNRGIHDFVGNIQNAAMRAADIIHHMLDFSRRSESKRKNCDLQTIIDRAITLAGNDYDLKKSYDFKQINIIKEYCHPSPTASCTETELEQVFLNLLRNAAQAMAVAVPEIAQPQIIIRVFCKDTCAVIEMEDNGPGMSPETQRRAFEPFFTTKPPGVGTGLGLSVSYFIITRSHDGRMTLDSRPGRGTKFTIELPIAPTGKEYDSCQRAS